MAEALPTSPLSENHPVVLFDGVCNLCNSFINFVIDRDPSSKMRFASLQNGAAREALQMLGRSAIPSEPESILLVENGRLYAGSTAVLRIVRHLSGPWWLLAALIVVPRPLRDAIYEWCAANRYRWFGKSDTCRVPTPDLRERFLDGP